MLQIEVVPIRLPAVQSARCRPWEEGQALEALVGVERQEQLPVAGHEMASFWPPAARRVPSREKPRAVISPGRPLQVARGAALSTLGPSSLGPAATARMAMIPEASAMASSQPRWRRCRYLPPRA